MSGQAPSPGAPRAASPATERERSCTPRPRAGEEARSAGEGAYSWLADYIGIPFLDGGRDRSGCDCWGLYRLVLRERASIEVPDFTDDYLSVAERARLNALLLTEIASPRWREIPAGAQRPFDAIAFRILGNVHVGVVIDSISMLHCRTDVNACLERYDRGIWPRLRVGFYRYAA